MYYLTTLYYHSQGSTLAPIHSAPLDPLTPLDMLLSSSFSSGSDCTSTSASDSISDADSGYVSAARAFTVYQSMPFWSHHHLDTLAPPLCVVRSHRSRSGRIEMYYAIVFCLFVIDFLISVNPASFMIPVREG